MSHLAENLRRERTAGKLSQEALAARSGISRSTIAVLESGARTATTTETLSQLAGALGVGVARLIEEPPAIKPAKRSRRQRRRAANSDS